MASNPPGRCCTIGVKHEGEAKGEIKNIDDSEFIQHLMREGTPISLTGIKVSTYFSYPEDKKTDNAILIFSDFIGHESINTQL